MRKIMKWNQQWSFLKGDLQEESIWESVTLPHTWNAFDGQDGGNDYYQGVAWYKKTLTLECDQKKVFLRFGAVNKKAEIWCNGQRVGEHLGGFSSFTYELTPFLQSGENEIRVKADNSNDLPIYPMHADFTFFGGIYREVELILFDGYAHFDMDTFGTDAIFVTPLMDGTVHIDTYVKGGYHVGAEIFDQEGNSLVQSELVPISNKHFEGEAVRLTLQVPTVQRWNGIHDAYLYEAKVYLYQEEQVDEIATNFGFRDYRVSASEGFFLNGKSYPLRGVCRHQDREDMGWALTEKEHDEDMTIIREIGANTIRLAHYQQAPYFYDLCDRYGMVVWAEIPFISVHDQREEADENLKLQMKELVVQNYNHPSVCFWGLANEIGIGGESERMYQILRELQQLTKKLDPTRLTVVANVGMTKTRSPLFHIADLASYNEYMGWYEGTMDQHGEFCDERHQEIPDIPLAISEYGAEAILKWHSEQPKIKDYSEEYQALLHERAEHAFEQRPYLWATWLWNMFDFAADARDEGGCKGRNNKGLVTFDRLVKKEAFYFYKASWNPEPMLYLCGKRFTKRADKKVKLKAYSNQNHLDLFVNGRHIETLFGKTIFEFKEIELEEQFNEVLIQTPNGMKDSMVLEKVDQAPEEYRYVIEKNISETVTQWFADLQNQEGGSLTKEIIVREGYLSVKDSMEEIYRYAEGYQAVQELIAKPLAVDNPKMAERMSTGGALSFSSVWNHISKLLPDEAYYLLNERLNKIKK